MASSAFLLSLVYYTFILAFLEASHAVLSPTTTPLFTSTIDTVGVTELLASAAVAMLALLVLIFAVYTLVCEMNWYADDYASVLSGLIQRVATRVVPIAILAASIITYDIYSSPEPAVKHSISLVSTIFSTPTLLYFVAFAIAVAQRMSLAFGVLHDVEHGIAKSNSDEKTMLICEWEQSLFAQERRQYYMY